MTQEDKELLLKDLCARLPYGVKAHIEHDTFYDEIEPYDGTVDTNTINDLLRNEKLEVKPYLRPMSSMTEEENAELLMYLNNSISENFSSLYYLSDMEQIEFWEERGTNKRDWLNANHFDYRGLIPKGLALEAPEDMYDMTKKILY